MNISPKLLRIQKSKLKSISRKDFNFRVPKNSLKFAKLKRYVVSLYKETSEIVINMISIFLFAMSLEAVLTNSVNLFLPNPSGDIFSQLGLLSTFLPSKHQIKTQYKSLMKMYHPDLNKGVNSHNISLIINSAYSKLKNMKQEEIDVFWITIVVDKLIPNFLKK